MHIKTRKLVPLFFILPAFLIIASLVFYPLVNMFYTSFMERIARQNTFVGLANYQKIFNDPLFNHSVKVTFIYAIGSTLFSLGIGLAAALLINEEFKGLTFVRIILLIPWVISGVVAALGFRWFFNIDYGPVNYALKTIGLISSPINFFSPKSAMITAIITNGWEGFPFIMLMSLGALRSIPTTLYDAAKIDGAGYIRRFIHVTIPGCLGAIITATLMVFFWGLSSFTIMHLLTEGGPVNVTRILPLYIFLRSFQTYDWGVASAASTVLFFIMLAFSGIYIYLLRRRGEI